MRPGQEIELEAWCEKGQGKTHAKWSPVCTASYRLLPEVRVTPPKPADDDDVAMAEASAADASAKNAVLSRPKPCVMPSSPPKTPGWSERVQLARVKDHFIFTVESTGALPPEVLFQEAVKLLMQKAVNIAGLLKDAVAGQASGAV